MKNWSNNSSKHFALKYCLFGTIKLTNQAIRSKFIYSGWETAFDEVGKWNYCNDYARNNTLFGVRSTSSMNTHNYRNSFLVLDEDLTDVK